MKIKLLDICHARSGDKGDAANIGLIARQERFYPIIKKLVTKARVKQHFKGICNGPVDRYELPNLWALNFLLHNTLGGGGTVSLKHDAQGKTLAAALLRMEIDVPPGLLKKTGTKAVHTKFEAALPATNEAPLAAGVTPIQKRTKKPALAAKQ